nr:ATP-binding protein [Oceanobacter mangrovi]
MGTAIASDTSPADATDATITAQRLQQLQQTEQLVALGLLAAGIAHEIKNPIAYISSNLAELNDDFGHLRQFVSAVDQAADLLGREHPVSQQLLQVWRAEQLADVLEFLPERLNDALEGVDRISHIVTDMKMLTLGTGSHKQLCDLRHELRAILNIARIRLGDGLTLEAELLPDPAPQIFCNAAQIGQVVLNLLVNAIQAVAASSGGGQIRLLERLHPGELELAVEDNGPGISASVREHIFDPFFTTKTDGDGTGMGLYLSQKLVADHQGRIEVHTNPGNGSCFSIFLPLAEGGKPDV